MCFYHVHLRYRSNDNRSVGLGSLKSEPKKREKGIDSDHQVYTLGLDRPKLTLNRLKILSSYFKMSFPNLYPNCEHSRQSAQSSFPTLVWGVVSMLSPEAACTTCGRWTLRIIRSLQDKFISGNGTG